MRKLYLKPDGSYYRFGEVQKNPEMATLLKNIAEQGTDYFYRGKVAQDLVELINQRGGCFTTDDLANYTPKFRQPVRSAYRDCEVVAFAPPSGGCAVVEMLNILEHSDLKAMGHNTADSLHALAEAIKLGFADRSEALGDPDFVHVDTDRLVSKTFAAQRFAQSGGHGGFAAAGHSDENDVPQSVVHGALHPPQGFIADHRAGELLAGALGLGHQHGKSACMGNPQLFCL